MLQFAYFNDWIALHRERQPDMIKNLNPLTFSEYGSVYTSAEYACLKKETPKTITFTEASPLFYTGEYQLYLDVVEYPTLLEIMYEQDCLSAQN